MSQKLAIGIDLGGTQLRVALVDGGAVVRRAAARTDVEGGPGGVLHQVEKLITEICAEEERKTLLGVGISCPGPLDTETGTVLHIPTLPRWEGFPLRQTLADKLRLPVLLENDGIAAAFGEWRFGAGRGLQHLVYVTVSTGIGGGVIVDGRLLHGRRGMAAHVGHFRMAQDGPTCTCGATACFEAFASGTALGRRAREAAERSPSEFLGRLAAETPIEARHVEEGARTGDAACLALLHEEGVFLGQGFTGLIHLYSPERLIMGGGVSQAFDLLEPEIHSVIQRDAIHPFKDVRVVRAALGDNSGLIGAAALAMEHAGRTS
ncbi:ROK family protein [Mesorhizobium sp. BAC0120]|uniref:ROK family protein n=1 Tax=Mesorhizobium sp. BAC0120 TaxID=3090670 RepID=UPI00298C462B|nr:ROK family protein [Mesorhizobium sp. BAC0120]MDW6024372.1 ROK family protein [Mesorhizobium sp. BAC0120]